MARFEHFLRQARSRRLVGVAIALVGTAAIAAWWGSTDVALPAATRRGSVSFPLWVLLPIPAATAVATGLASDMADLERMASRRIWLWDLGYLAVAATVAAGLIAAVLALTGQHIAVLPSVRNLVAWTGVAVLSGKLFGRRLAFVLPIAAIFPLDWFGFDFETSQPLWWAMPMQPFDLVTALVAAAMLMMGVIAVCVSPWHARRMLTLIRIARRGRQYAKDVRPIDRLAPHKRDYDISLS